MLIDQDTLAVVSVSRTGTTNYAITVDWVNQGTPRGRYLVEFATEAEFVAFANHAGFADVARQLATLLVNATNDGIKNATFDAAPGKTFKVTTKATQV